MHVAVRVSLQNTAQATALWSLRDAVGASGSANCRLPPFAIGCDITNNHRFDQWLLYGPAVCHRRLRPSTVEWLETSTYMHLGEAESSHMVFRSESRAYRVRHGLGMIHHTTEQPDSAWVALQLHRRKARNRPRPRVHLGPMTGTASTLAKKGTQGRLRPVVGGSLAFSDSRTLRDGARLITDCGDDLLHPGSDADAGHLRRAHPAPATPSVHPRYSSRRHASSLHMHRVPHVREYVLDGLRNIFASDERCRIDAATTQNLLERGGANGCSRILRDLVFV
mmetsp:Transcript_31619/g.71433  ORF Transcript_31619/g.71433 Transcript_31619/m.71433 type:complete len:280 (-) Transcript_31619:55-894(-)